MAAGARVGIVIHAVLWRAVLVVCLALGITPEARGQAPDLPASSLEHPAEGVYVHYGALAEMSIANAGDVANVGFVVGERCVAVIDTGGTYAVGRALRRAIRDVTPLPICYVINTHVHPDHIFGNAAFAEDGVTFMGHGRLAEAMRRRGPTYLNAVRRDLGTAAQGTTLVLPTRGVIQVERIDVGNRVLELRAWPTAHTDTDLTVFDETSGTLWLGDLGFAQHLPVVDGNLRGFVAAIAALKKMNARRAIPGHGRATAWPDSILPEERYLRRLLTDVKAALAARQTLAQAIETVPCDDADRWLLIEVFHKRNVSAAYAELEWE